MEIKFKMNCRTLYEIKYQKLILLVKTHEMCSAEKYPKIALSDLKNFSK